MATKLEIIENRIKSAINKSTLIHDSSHLSIMTKTTGFLFWKKTELKISGRVDYDREKDAIDKIVEEEASDLPVVNNLRVEKR